MIVEEPLSAKKNSSTKFPALATDLLPELHDPIAISKAQVTMEALMLEKTDNGLLSVVSNGVKTEEKLLIEEMAQQSYNERLKDYRVAEDFLRNLNWMARADAMHVKYATLLKEKNNLLKNSSISAFIAALDVIAPPLSSEIVLNMRERQRCAQFEEIRKVLKTQQIDCADRQRYSFVANSSSVDMRLLHKRLESRCGEWIKWIDKALLDPWQPLPSIQNTAVACTYIVRNDDIPPGVLRMYYEIISNDVGEDNTKRSVPSGMTMNVNLGFIQDEKRWQANLSIPKTAIAKKFQCYVDFDVSQEKAIILQRYFNRSRVDVSLTKRTGVCLCRTVDFAKTTQPIKLEPLLRQCTHAVKSNLIGTMRNQREKLPFHLLLTFKVFEPISGNAKQALEAKYLTLLEPLPPSFAPLSTLLMGKEAPTTMVEPAKPRETPPPLSPLSKKATLPPLNETFLKKFFPSTASTDSGLPSPLPSSPPSFLDAVPVKGKEVGGEGESEEATLLLAVEDAYDEAMDRETGSPTRWPDVQTVLADPLAAENFVSVEALEAILKEEMLEMVYKDAAKRRASLEARRQQLIEAIQTGGISQEVYCDNLEKQIVTDTEVVKDLQTKGKLEEAKIISLRIQAMTAALAQAEE